jgi:hypothetical protein
MKSLPKFAVTFYKFVFRDFSSLSPKHKVSNKLSYQYVAKRIGAESITFVSNALPKLGKAAETSMITGEPIEVPTGFQLHWRSKLPCFMYEYFKDAWDEVSGIPLWVLAREQSKQDCAFALWAIRQVCCAFSKARDLGSLVTDEEALSAFRTRISQECEINAPSWLLNQARRLITEVVMDGDRLNAMLAQWASEPYGRHGPGAVAGKEKSLRKWFFKRISGVDQRLYQFRSATLSRENYLEPSHGPSLIGQADAVSRATCVPKDFRSPRIICIEPKEFQFAQQGIWLVLRDLIQTHPLTKKSINFEHQERNAVLCKRHDVATIDLKDASDTVMLKLCRILFPREFFKLATRYRSRNISINGDKIRPKCFASMGSALCFPIETLVFWAIAQSAIHPMDSRLPVRVFGDDIVVPKGSANFVIKMLETCGFRVNTNKTCIDTPIRESCGAFVYSGIDVRITRFKSTRCENLSDWLALLENGKELHGNQLVAAGNACLLFAKDWWHVPFGRGSIPPSSDGYGCQSRWNPNLQRTEYRLPRQVTRRGNEAASVDAMLYAWLIGSSTEPIPYGTEKVKVGWTAL